MSNASRRRLRIQWRNRYSNETGFVKAIREGKRYFENGCLEESRRFRSEAECQKAIDTLKAIGEGENNEFIITDLNGVAVN